MRASILATVWIGFPKPRSASQVAACIVSRRDAVLSRSTASTQKHERRTRVAAAAATSQPRTPDPSCGLIDDALRNYPVL